MGRTSSFIYTLVFKNNSSTLGDVCLYQLPPEGVAGVLPLAWFAQAAHPTTRIKFTWTPAYSFIWSQSGTLIPGTVCFANQIWDADPVTGNQVTFTMDGGAFTFKNQTQGSSAGTYTIREDGTIPPRKASVGLGMEDSGIYVQQAAPNITLALKPVPNYWITFGSFVEGEALDTASLNNPAQIIYPTNIYSMTAILNEDNSWTISSTTEVNRMYATARNQYGRAEWGRRYIDTIHIPEQYHD